MIEDRDADTVAVTEGCRGQRKRNHENDDCRGGRGSATYHVVMVAECLVSRDRLRT